MTSGLSRRQFLQTTAGASALVASGARFAHAAFPERGILVIVPYAAGGGSDISARLLAKDLESILGKPVTVENRAGGGGWIGWGSLAASKPDGYTIGYINVPNIFAGYLDRSQGGARKENCNCTATAGCCSIQSSTKSSGSQRRTAARRWMRA